ncbi:serine/threonine-protein kinase [Streptomyces sp. NPDC058001]|uniref:serine/threonine-protein kinase n=1 Tax=Streptomyces sp. NPDC058001 TaxID=3346300 RepID=UPI0036E660CF
MQPLDPDEPTTVGPYRLLGRLGAGGMGRVYLGRTAGGRTVAIKVVHPHFALDEEFRARFHREVEAARRVGGDWTAPVLDADPDASVPWVATGYVAGPSLARAVKGPEGPVPLPEHTVRVLGAGLAEALARVHGLGLVHRDVKPSNVLLALDGPRLIDFGIARATDGTASLTSTGVSIGSPGYMAPEQILGKGVTGASDVFSLGAVLVYAATGEPPFPGDSSASLLYKVVHEEPELGAVRGGLRDIVAACLRKDPAARPTPADLAHRLTPEGPARLVSTGWLPGPLVEQVSRSAVGLLDLEATGDVPGGRLDGSGTGTGTDIGGAGVSGPVSFSGVSVAGVFGPPDPSYGQPGPYTNLGTGGAGGASSSGEVVGGGVSAPRTAVTHESAGVGVGPGSVPGSGSGSGSGGLSLSLAATRDPNGRGRRVSCTVALAVAGALAAVTVGSVFVFDLLPGLNKGKSSDTAGQPPAASGAPQPSSGTDGGAATSVPASFLGTWEGPGVALDGSLPMGTFRVTVRQGTVGEEFGTFRQTDQIGGVCDDVLILKKATADGIVATSRAKESNGSQCTTGDHEVRLTPKGDQLTYRTDNPEAGDPEARMDKVG